MTVYDYYISLPLAPAFTDNIAAAITLVSDSGGESPTTYANPAGTDAVPLPPLYDPMHGTKSASGRAMLHFRMPVRYTATELITFLESKMTGSKPPIIVEAIRSRDKIIETPNADPLLPSTWDYETVVAPNKAHFIPFMNDIPDGTLDGNGNPNMRPVTAGDSFALSCYMGVDPITLA